jgi:hypothetical protein
VKKSQINSENQTHADVDHGHGDNMVEVEARIAEFDEGDDGNIGDERDDANTDSEGNDANTGDEDNHATIHEDTNSSSHLDTVAFVERSFSKLKLLKSYMCSTMTQERFSGLATLALENDILEKINYNAMNEDFISRNT